MIAGYILFWKLYSYFCTFLFLYVFPNVPLNIESILELSGAIILGVPLICLISHLLHQYLDQKIANKQIKNFIYLCIIFILLLIWIFLPTSPEK